MSKGPQVNSCALVAGSSLCKYDKRAFISDPEEGLSATDLPAVVGGEE